jgi:hypothetical protein
MHPQLQAITAEFEQAQARLHRLSERLPDALWSQRPDPGRWSVAECVAHLNLTTEAFLPILRSGLAEAGARGGGAPRRYRRDPLGWLVWIGSGPPARVRLRTAAAFVPASTEAPEAILSSFDSLQAEQLACVRAAEGLPIQMVKIASPFDPRARYNLFAALCILARHQHRHLWQAEQAAGAVSAAAPVVARA